MLPAAFLILCIVLRIVPHPWNFTPVGASAVLAGRTLPPAAAIAFTLLSMFLGDAALAWLRGYPLLSGATPFIYGGFVVQVALGRRLRARRGGALLAAGLGAGAFFLLSNLGVFIAGGLYPRTAGGLVACYLAALPFLGGTLLGDLFFTAVFSLAYRGAACRLQGRGLPWSPVPRAAWLLPLLFVLGAPGCAPGEEGTAAVAPGADLGPGADLARPPGDLQAGADPFADRVVSYQPGPGAGFGQDRFPGVVLGPPDGGGPGAGGLDVLSLGTGGVIVLEMTDIGIVDGPGPDLLVFENPFPGNEETGHIAASEDGVIWREWPCDPTDGAGRYPGCAGVRPVLAARDNGISPTDPAQAGGDAFDLAAVGLSRARFVRVRDSGRNRVGAPTAGFDLDGVAVVHGEPLR